MDPATIAALAGMGINVVGGAIGHFASAEDEAEYQRQLEQMAQAYEGIDAPTLAALQARSANSTLTGMQSDFGNTGARNAAIEALMREGLSGGNTLETQLAQANAQRAAGQAARSGSQAALQSAASRGTGGGAAALQAQLMGASQGADRAAQVGLQGAANARRSALDALAQGGGMAGQAEQADSAREMARRQSLDAMARFNAEQAASTDRFNVGTQQQNFQNRLTVAQQRAEAARIRAGGKKESANRTRNLWGGIGQAGGQAGAAFGAYGKTGGG